MKNNIDVATPDFWVCFPGKAQGGKDLYERSRYYPVIRRSEIHLYQETDGYPHFRVAKHMTLRQAKKMAKKLMSGKEIAPQSTFITHNLWWKP